MQKCFMLYFLLALYFTMYVSQKSIDNSLRGFTQKDFDL